MKKEVKVIIDGKQYLFCEESTEDVGMNNESTDIPVNEEMEYATQFMISDYEQSMEMLRHYDHNNWEITKFAFGEILVIIGACWTIYSLDMEILASGQKNIIIIFLLTAGLLFAILSLFIICKNRTYFALTSRHINEYRGHAYKNKPLGFENEVKYWSKSIFPKALDYCSTQLFCIYLIVFLNSFIFSGLIQFLFSVSICAAFFAGILFCVISIIVVVCGLKGR